ncbi:MAG: cytochrome C oxidase subunit II, partial [Treponema sp.]|nr:cytochrome C oxidase subunit II [Treponema sp.]
NRIKTTIKQKTGEPLYEDIAKVWDEVSFVKPAETEVERSNRTYIYEKDKVKARIILMRKRMKGMYDYQYPIERRVMEERLSFLEKEFTRFDYMINPYHLQPGLILDVDITSIKRKQATMMSMANVLNEFLHGVSKGFQDAAFASFSRRRSTVREDINQSFGSTEDTGSKHAVAQAPAQSYLDMINSDNASTEGAASTADASPVKAIEAPKKRGRGRAPARADKAVAAKPAKVPGKRGRKPAIRRRGDSGLKEV